MHNKISAILITKNEEKNIAACLESIKWVDEIIVVDADSTDNTTQICRDFGAIVVTANWEGFGPQKNKALSLAKNAWVLSIDADERVTQQLRDEILTAIANADHTTTLAYKIPRQNYFYQRQLKYCLSAKGDAPIRLFKRTFAKFSDDLVHERVLITNNNHSNIGLLTNQLIHLPFANLEEILEKNNFYSSLGVAKLIEKKVRPSICKALLHASWVFIKIYCIKLGFLDGWPGFLIAFANFEGTFYRYAKLIEHYRQQSEN